MSGNPDYDGDGWDCQGDDPDQDYYETHCLHCGAEVDHYLGCPDDPDPDYEAEAQAREAAP